MSVPEIPGGFSPTFTPCLFSHPGKQTRLASNKIADKRFRIEIYEHLHSDFMLYSLEERLGVVEKKDDNEHDSNSFHQRYLRTEV
jgi:hypothetical protein